MAPEHLLKRGQKAQPGRLARLLCEEIGGVEAHLRSFFDHGPWGFLTLVPFGRGGPDDFGRELVHPVADLDNVVAQL
jgi:hypothetical protein